LFVYRETGVLRADFCFTANVYLFIYYLFRGQKHAKFGAISHDFELLNFDGEYQQRSDIRLVGSTRSGRRNENEADYDDKEATVNSSGDY